MQKEHHLVMIPGLNDQGFLQKRLMNLVPKYWQKYGVVGHIISPNWEDGEEFKPKLERMLGKVDELIEEGHEVSVLGLSAGGSAALNVFCQRKNVLKGAVNGTGRLRVGENVRPSLDWAARNSPAFKESVVLFESQNEKILTEDNRKRIMTVRPLWDEIVPISTSPLEGADNRVVPVVGHLLAGGYVCFVYGKEIVNFLNHI